MPYEVQQPGTIALRGVAFEGSATEGSRSQRVVKHEGGEVKSVATIIINNYLIKLLSVGYSPKTFRYHVCIHHPRQLM